MRQKLKRSAAALLCLVILVQFSGLSLPVSAEPASEIWDGSVAASFAGGTGTEEDPYIIRTPQQLAYLAQQVNSGTSYEGNYFRQAADLLLNDTTDWERWGVSNDTKQRIAPANRWMPIGNDAAFFSGVYDGGGHTVSGMFVSFFGEARVSEVYHGLFGYVSGGTILNLNIAQSRVDNEGDPDVRGGKEYEAMELSCLGAVVGSIRGGTVSGCSNSGCVSGSGGFMNYIGGIAGCAENSTVSGCENTSHIHGTGEGVHAGGVAGQIMGCQLKGCSNFGAVDASGSSDELIGGLVGYAKNGTVIGCCNTGAISARCYNAYSGGLIGYSFGGVKIDCCYNSGMVSANGFSASAGGLVGVSMNPLTSDNSYNVGTVSCAANDIPKYGGIVGEFFGGEVRNCYYLDTCVAERSAQGTALTDTQMRMQESFVGFDFKNVWSMEGDPDYSYPEIIGLPMTNPFVDVAEGAYYYNAVLWAVAHDPQVTAGTDATHFSPNSACTRGQVVTFLWRANGCPEPKSTTHPFTDVKESGFYYKAMLWAVENGITTGASKTTFAPGKPCTRGQVVTFLWRAQGSPAPKTTTHPFTDVNESGYYFKAMLWAVENGVTTGASKTTFAPDKSCTRGQVVTFLYRAEGGK